ncbi:MAG: PqqD family protein [Ruminococcaceae bacterium]|nr:PqqD family protein [Oscillospiraceae bacterium]
MKISPDFAMREVAGTPIVVPCRAGITDTTLMKLNSTACFLWRILQNGCDCEDTLVSALCDEFEVSTDTAKTDVAAFLQQLRNIGALV